MASSIRVAGGWRALAAAAVRVGGAWRTCSGLWIREAGAWRQFYTATPPDPDPEPSALDTSAAVVSASWILPGVTWQGWVSNCVVGAGTASIVVSHRVNGGGWTGDTYYNVAPGNTVGSYTFSVSAGQTLEFRMVPYSRVNGEGTAGPASTFSVPQPA